MKKLLFVFMILCCCCCGFAQSIKLSKAGIVPTIAPENTKILLHFNGDLKNTATGDFWTSDSTSFSIEPAAAKYGAGGLLTELVATVPTSLEAPAADVANVAAIGAGDFAFEGWVQVASITQASTSAAISLCSAFFLKDGGESLQLNVSAAIASGSLSQYELNLNASRSTGGVVAFSVVGVDAGTWRHFAFSRSSGRMTLFVDGSVVASTTNAVAAFDFSDTERIANLFPSAASGISFESYLDDYHLTTNAYDDNFTPPEEIGRLISAKVALKNGTGRISITEAMP